MNLFLVIQLMIVRNFHGIFLNISCVPIKRHFVLDLVSKINLSQLILFRETYKNKNLGNNVLFKNKKLI